MKSKVTILWFLVVLTVVSVGIGYLTYPKQYGTNLQNNPTETVQEFFGLIEKSERKNLENYITYSPEIFLIQRREQVIATSKNSDYQMQENNSVNDSSNTAITVAEESNKPLNDLERQAFPTKKDLVNAICPDYLFKQKRYLKKIVQVFEKGDQARVDVLMGSRVEEEGWWGDIPTKVWLYKENDGKWRIFWQ
jgi:hypothetical protein